MAFELSHADLARINHETETVRACRTGQTASDHDVDEPAIEAECFRHRKVVGGLTCGVDGLGGVMAGPAGHMVQRGLPAIALRMRVTQQIFEPLPALGMRLGHGRPSQNKHAASAGSASRRRAAGVAARGGPERRVAGSGGRGYLKSGFSRIAFPKPVRRANDGRVLVRGLAHLSALLLAT